MTSTEHHPDVTDNGDGAPSSPFNSSPFSSRATSPQEDQQLADDQVAPPEDCDAVLETIDSCVACAEGVAVQNQYEDELMQQEEAIEKHGLSEEEAALIRLQIMEEQKKRKEDDAVSSFAIPDSLDLNLCGNEDDGDDRVSHFPPASAQQETANPEAPPSDERASSPASVGVSSVQSHQSSSKNCAICFDGADGDESPNSQRSTVTYAYLPCCGSDGREETSTTKVCTSCILLLTSPTSDGQERVGRCPRCRSWIAVTTEGGTVAVRALETAGKCNICYQMKTVLVENHQVCDACFLGRQRPLLYECEQCNGVQRIPHPIYRYQPSVDTFGSTSWACHRQCKKFTNWRILPDQVRFIATGDTPDEWGEDYLEVARARVREARLGIAETNNDGNRSGESTSSGCVVQ